MSLESFDEEATYDNEISPLMAKIIEICKAKGIPMVAVFQYADKGEDPCYCSTVLPGPVGRKSDHMKRLIDLTIAEKRRSQPFAVAITEETKPDGSVHLTFQTIK